MTKFKIGDCVKCINFDGSAGREILLLYGGSPIIVTDVYVDYGIDFICINGTTDRNRWGVYAKRFEFAETETQLDATEYEETMEYERLING